MKTRRFGCILFLLLPFFAYSILRSGFIQKLPNYFLPPACDEVLFARFINNALSEMRVTYDIYRQTRVIAIDEIGNDICSFTTTTNPNPYSNFWSSTSPDLKFVAFTVNQISMNNIQHLFIVNTNDQRYVRFTVENPEDHIQDIAWSPNNETLATVSYANSCCIPSSNTYITLMSSSAEPIWKVDLGVTTRYSGYLEWTEDGRQILYGHDAVTVWGIPGNTALAEPYWCFINETGTEWGCKEGAKDSS